MTTIAVTGAAGSLGRRAILHFAAHAHVDRIIAIDRAAPAAPTATVMWHRRDLRSGELAESFAGSDTVVHLAEESGEPGDSVPTLAILDAVLEGASRAEVPHVVLLSSAMVYGAHADNPVPITESQPLRPNRDLAYAVAKKELEEAGQAWAGEDTNRTVTVLRPTTTLSEHGSAWAAKALRSATLVRPDQVDPPLQFLHYDDLASAVALVTIERLGGAFNVAPDGWLGPDVFRDLVGGIQLRVPERVNDRFLAAGRRLGLKSTPAGIEDYVRQPWVVANDRLRAKGWQPTFSNSEAFVIGTPPPPWSVTAQERQEIALAVAALGLAGLAAAATGIARRVTR